MISVIASAAKRPGCLAIVLDAIAEFGQLFYTEQVPSSLDEVLNAKPARTRAPRRK